jgi:hypothetical protein
LRVGVICYLHKHLIDDVIALFLFETEFAQLRFAGFQNVVVAQGVLDVDGVFHILVFEGDFHVIRDVLEFN